MAVRFDAATDAYTATTALPTGTSWSVTFWVMVVSMSGTTGHKFFELYTDAGGELDFVMIGTTFGDTVLEVFQGPDVIGTGFGALTLGNWYRIGYVQSGSTGTVYAAPATGSFSSYSDATFAGPNPALTLYVGVSHEGQHLNGRVSALKLWDAALTQAEVETELGQFLPVRATNLIRYHPFHIAETVNYANSATSLTAGSTATSTEADPPIPWTIGTHNRVTITPRMPTVDTGKDVFGTAGFEFSIQAVETGLSITDRSWTVVSGPAEVATEIGTTSLLSWFPATAGVYELEYRVTNAAGQAYDTVYATVNATGTVVNSASVSGTGTTQTCNKPTGLAQGDVMLAVQSGDFAAHDEMRPPVGWQPQLEYDVGQDSLHLKTWTLTAGASEPSTYTFAQGTGSAGVVTITAVRGVAEAGVQGELTYDAGTGATRTAPSVEKAVPGAVLLAGAMAGPGAARTWTPPTGMTEQADVQVSTNTTHTVASLLDPGGPTGTRDFTLSGTAGATGGIQWSVVFPMPPDPRRGTDNKSMIAFVRTT